MTQFHSHSAGHGAATNTVVAPAPILTVSGLTVTVAAAEGTERPILTDISFSLSRGETLGVLGESGAGKSTLSRALLHLLPDSFRFQCGAIRFDGSPLRDRKDDELRSIRGNRISIVFQDSSTLNPVLRVEDQVAEIVRAHRDWEKSRCLQEARAMLEIVGLGDERFFRAYPHQLSGGQKQRVAIAQALVCRPEVLIADEPTASLDAASTRDILDLLQRLRHQHNIAVIFISHQPEALAYLSDRIIVLYGGQIIEEGTAISIFESPLHPYTRALLACQSPLANTQPESGKLRWPFIPSGTHSQVPGPGCIFQSRCELRREVCAHSSPAISVMSASHEVRCFEFQAEGA